jgi:hypothetical protein
MNRHLLAMSPIVRQQSSSNSNDTPWDGNNYPIIWNALLLDEDI